MNIFVVNCDISVRKMAFAEVDAGFLFSKKEIASRNVVVNSMD